MSFDIRPGQTVGLAGLLGSGRSETARLRFYLLGSVLGALLIQTLTTTLLLKDVSPNLLALPKAILVIAVCLMQSGGFRAQLGALIPKRGGGVAKEVTA